MARIERLALDQDWLEMGRVLKALKLKLSPPEREDLLNHLGISPRTYFYLLSVVKKLDAYALTPHPGTTWRKMSEIAPILNRSNASALLKAAADLSMKDLIALRNRL